MSLSPTDFKDCNCFDNLRWDWERNRYIASEEPCIIHPKKLLVLHKEMITRGLHLLGSGCSRAAFKSPSGKFVYKVPINSMGITVNLFESRMYRAQKDDKIVPMGCERYDNLRDRIAPCRLHRSGILVMELVKAGYHWISHFADYTSRTVLPGLPDETLTFEDIDALSCIDGAQGGVARDGKFKLYDYGAGTLVNGKDWNDWYHTGGQL